MNKARVLIIDDEIAICKSLSYTLSARYEVMSTTSPIKAMEIIRCTDIDVCLLDIRIGVFDGMDVLREIRSIDESIQIIMITAYGSVSNVVEAIKSGAFTYLTKPLELDKLELSIEQALKFKSLNEKVEYLNNQLITHNTVNGIIGHSYLMKQVFLMIDKVKDADICIVISGESGTGKELVARAIHFSGKRAKEKFVEVNCAAIPESLLEDEMFGHKKGSFTGAVSDREGKFAYAGHGTIFLDEIGDMSPTLQAKLLRVLQEKTYTQLGDNKLHKIDARVVAATNKDLKAMVELGKFREDLYFRLNVVEIKIPPLRERKQDIPLLITHFITRFNAELGRRINGISKDAERRLLQYDYPGNVRELANIIESSMLMCNNDTIDLKDMPVIVPIRKEPEYIAGSNSVPEFFAGMTLKEAEKKLIEAALKKNRWHITTTASSLGLSDKGLRNKIKSYDIKREK